ncbi:hypothetical protein M501DRAFT_902956, partial [Patellaria atrata CBS 101060]
KKRARATPKIGRPLSEEERLLLKLKEDEKLPWKDIIRIFRSRLDKEYQIPMLQMRYKRLRGRLCQSADGEEKALRLADRHWETNKWDIISEKMLQFGSTHRWTPKKCAQKWQEL